MRTITLAVVAAVAVVALGSCATAAKETKWVRPNSTADLWNKDDMECDRDGYQSHPGPGERKDAYERCLTARGWQKQSVEESEK